MREAFLILMTFSAIAIQLYSFREPLFQNIYFKKRGFYNSISFENDGKNSNIYLYLVLKYFGYFFQFQDKVI